MSKIIALVALFALNCHAFPRYHRLRREADSALKYGPCKNTYDQCPEWKGEGMCTSAQYKDYMMTVCPVTCEFCRESEGGEHVDSEIVSPSDETSKATENSPNPVSYTHDTPSEQSTEQSTSAVASIDETSQSSNTDSQKPASETVSNQQQEAALTPPTEQQTSQQNGQSENRENVGSTNVENLATNNNQNSDDEYQAMLKHYYENVQKQQAEYQRSIAQSYPEYQNQPSVTNSESTNSNTVQAAESTPAANPVTPAQAAPLPSSPSQSAPVAPAPLPNNVPNPIAVATGQNTPIVINSPEAEPYDPSKTSSALYKEKSNKKVTPEEESKPDSQVGTSGDSKFKTSHNKASNSTEDSDEATNEKVKSESKHIEQTIKSAKEKRISAEKHLREKQGLKKLVTDKNIQKNPKVITESIKNNTTEENKHATGKSDDDADNDDDDDDDQDADIQGYDSKRANLTAPIDDDVPNSETTDTANNVGDTGSGSGSWGWENDESESDEESGSGDMGQLDDLQELNMLMNLNYDDYEGSEAYDTVAENRNINNNNEHNDVIVDSSKKITRDKVPISEEISEENDESESGSGEESGNSETEVIESKQQGKYEETEKKNKASAKNNILDTPIHSSQEEEPNSNDASETDDNNSGSSGQSESEPEDEETPVDEEGSARDEEALPLQHSDEKLKQSSKGSISLVLRQNFQSSYKNIEAPSYQMLSGNVKKDFGKVLKHVKMQDISFSEANIEGNPRQMGKTKVTFNLDKNDNSVMKALTKLVDSGSINGLSVVSGSLEYDE